MNVNSMILKIRPCLFTQIDANIKGLTLSSYKKYDYSVLLTKDCRRNFSNLTSLQNNFLTSSNSILTCLPFCIRYQSSNIKSDEVKQKLDDKEAAVEAPELTKVEKLKKAVTEYGSTVIVFHVGISLVSLGTCYLLVSSGLDTSRIFMTMGLDDWVTKSQIAASAGTFAVAYAVHKVFAPVRITITLASVPFIVRYLRGIGFLKK